MRHIQILFDGILKLSEELTDNQLDDILNEISNEIVARFGIKHLTDEALAKCDIEVDSFKNFEGEVIDTLNDIDKKRYQTWSHNLEELKKLEIKNIKYK